MFFLRRAMKVNWTSRISNEAILKQVNGERRIIKEVRKRQSKYIGHIIRNGKIENPLTKDNFVGR
jgi:ribosomal 50S subunit-associated protein YjgA (DUF615 family)